MVNIDFSKKKLEIKLDYKISWQRDILDFINEWYNDKDYIIAYTSGSTSEPKKVKIDKEAMKESAKMTLDFLGLKTNESSLVCMPVRYIAGKMMIVRSIVGKLNLYAVEPSLNPFEKLNFNINFSAINPMQLQNSFEKIHLINNILVGGAPISNELEIRIKQKSHNSIFETFGMTETISHIALRKISNQEDNCFKPLRDIKIRTDSRECLCVKVPFIEKEIITNDIVRIFLRGGFKWIGRYDNVINSGGIKIFPEVVEKELTSIMDRDFFISSIQDESFGEKLVLIVEGDRDLEFEERINNFTFTFKYYKPREIIFVNKFQRTQTGKIKRIFSN